jgi:hypothetical protein
MVPQLTQHVRGMEAVECGLGQVEQLVEELRNAAGEQSSSGLVSTTVERAGPRGTGSILLPRPRRLPRAR